MISLENLKQLSELQQDFANSEYLAQATSLGSIFDTMMFPDYDNAINLIDVNRTLTVHINQFIENAENFDFSSYEQWLNKIKFIVGEINEFKPNELLM